MSRRYYRVVGRQRQRCIKALQRTPLLAYIGPPVRCLRSTIVMYDYRSVPAGHKKIDPEPATQKFIREIEADYD
jgi:hypothetical protein